MGFCQKYIEEASFRRRVSCLPVEMVEQGFDLVAASRNKNCVLFMASMMDASVGPVPERRPPPSPPSPPSLPPPPPPHSLPWSTLLVNLGIPTQTCDRIEKSTAPPFPDQISGVTR